MVATAISGVSVAAEHTDGDGSESDIFKTDPATHHGHVVTTLEITGVSIALFVLAVGLGIAEMRRRGLPLQPVRTELVVAAVAGFAAIALVAVPAMLGWGVIPGFACGATLMRTHRHITRLKRHAAPLPSET